MAVHVLLRRGMGPGVQIIIPIVGDVLDGDGLTDLLRGSDTVADAPAAFASVWAARRDAEQMVEEFDLTGPLAGSGPRVSYRSPPTSALSTRCPGRTSPLSSAPAARSRTPPAGTST